ncbi:helix-turn-helix domain-containing protein [Streptomyces sp. NBC_00091]|uniref:helix-turn-helix domain-containing protein n=1 Tax=Streptomyces sp. NBC_00091 TaxID=2975648 RepID=UPI00225AD4D5|nr:helix-turn-helix domain-containing protein [Streptomyces sp. NBC_00091]MCX5380148.1 helix-turn-helix domain-containing protein [Streptomyces sp. NBC_00091]
MLTTVTEGVRELLGLLAQGAPAEAFARPSAAARAAGAPAGELAALEEATRVALEVHRTLIQHRTREAELTALFDTAGDLAALRDLDSVLRAITHRAKQLLHTDVTYLSLNDEAAGDTFMRVTDGSVSAAFQQLRLGMGEGLGGLVAQTARPYATGDYQRDPRFRHTAAIDGAVGEEDLRAILGVPLRLGPKVIGVLFAADRSPREFGPREVALLSSLADHAAIAIDGARLLEETRRALAELGAASRVIQENSDALRRAEEAHDRLTGLVLRGGDIAEVAAAIGALLEGGTLIHDADGAELARAQADPCPPPARAVAASRAGGRAVAEAGTWVCAVLAGPELLGSITLTGRRGLDEAGRRLFERAATVTALLLLLSRSVAQTEDRIRGELLGDLLSPSADPGSLAVRARRLGVDLARPHALFVLHSDTAPRPRLLTAAAHHARDRRGLAGVHHDHAVLLAPSEDTGADAARLAAALGRTVGAPVTVGAARADGSPAGLPAAHAEALRCLSTLRSLGRAGDGSTLADLGFLGVLLGDRPDLSGFVRAALGPVLDYDARRGSDLVRTLRVYFATGMSRARAKEALHVHVNTVVQRLDRIGRLLGPDWQSPDRALELQLALRLHQVSAPAGPGAVSP